MWEGRRGQHPPVRVVRTGRGGEGVREAWKKVWIRVSPSCQDDRSLRRPRGEAC